jgi:hypothetical protein
MKTLRSDNLVEVPEKIVMEAWDAIGNEEDSGFKIVLDAAEVYKSANMTPVFIFDTYNGDIYCYAKETFGKVLH